MLPAQDKTCDRIKEAGCAHYCFSRCNRIARKRDTKNGPRRQRTEMTPPLPDPAHGLIRRMGPICADFGGPPANTGEDRTGCLSMQSEAKRSRGPLLPAICDLQGDFQKLQGE